jgi:hypothetical protein
VEIFGRSYSSQLMPRQKYGGRGGEAVKMPLLLGQESLLARP